MLLELDRVTKRYPRGDGYVVALHEASVVVEAGHYVAVWGSPSSGKSTLLRLAAGLERPDGGRIRFAGEDLLRMPRTRRAELLAREIGCVWASPPPIGGLTALDYVGLPLLRATSRRAARNAARRDLARVDVEHCISARWEELSDSDRARVSLAHALVRRPRLLIIDEPTGKLSFGDREGILQLLRNLAEHDGIAVLMTVPAAAQAMQAHTVVSLHDARAVSSAPPRVAELFDFPRERAHR